MHSQLPTFALMMLFVTGCRSTTPMAGVQNANNTNARVGTGVGISLSEPSSENRTQDAAKKENLDCVFGKNLSSMTNSADFELEKRGTVERMAASKNLEGKTLLFAYTEYVYKPTNTRYSVFNTFLKSVDGGVTKGWIQTSLGQEVVAEVDDGDIVNCTVISQSDKKIENVQDEFCFFGFELNNFMESSRFKIQFEKELFRTGRIPGESKRRQKYRMYKINEAKNSKHEFSMFLKSSEIQGSKNYNGWIENLGDSELVALIGESEIYECIVDSVGQITGKIVESHDQCIFGRDFHDIEVSPEFVLSNIESEILMPSRIRKSSKQKIYKRRALLHKSTGKSYIVFHTFRDEDDAGKTQGWIETIDGRVAAEIFENGIRSCHP